jgi:predicted  nucleic acid-binding Zn-ribbon protein
VSGAGAASGAGGSVTGTFEQLLAVQEHDTKVDQLRHRRASLPERAELAELERRRGALEGRMGELQAQRDALGERQAALEAQIESAKTRKAELERRMYGGQVASARDLAAMDDEVRQLSRHVTELENRELEVMEQIEPLDADLQAAEAERDTIDSRAGELRASIAHAEKELDAQIDTELAARRPLSASLPAELLARYEALRTKLGGTGAARLVGSSCSGCHLTLPAMEVDRIKHAPPEAVLTCDNCGRILVR